MLFGFAFQTSFAFAVTGDELAAQLHALISQEVEIDSLGHSVLVETEDALLELLKADERVVQAPVLTKTLVATIVAQHFTAAKVSVKKAQSLADPYLRKLPLSLGPEDATRLLEIIVPFLHEGGFCQGDPLSDEGANCAFFYVPSEFSEEVSFSGTYEVPSKGAIFGIPILPPDSAAYQVLSGCSVDNGFCQFSSLIPSLSDSQTMSLASGTETGGDSGVRDGNYSVFRVRVPWSAGWYFKYKCTFSCEVWGEIYASGNIQYLANASDSFVALLPMALYCSSSCYWKTVGNYILQGLGLQRTPSGQEMLDFFVENADQKNWQLRQGGSYLRHDAKSPCVIPQPYETRPAYRYFQEWKADLPYSQSVDWDFKTFFQQQPTSSQTVLLSTNMMPPPTFATGPVPQINTSTLANMQVPTTANWSWTYNFTEVRGWAPNLIFSGTDNAAYPTNACGLDLAWTWHGQASSGRHSLPTVDWKFEVYGSHPPYATAQAGCQNGATKSWGQCSGKVYSSSGAIGVFGRATNSRSGYNGEARFSCSSGGWTYMDGTCTSSSGSGPPPVIP